MTWFMASRYLGFVRAGEPHWVQHGRLFLHPSSTEWWRFLIFVGILLLTGKGLIRKVGRTRSSGGNA